MRRALLVFALLGCTPTAPVSIDGGESDARESDAGIDTVVACEGVTLAPGLECEVLGGPLSAPRDVWALEDGTIIATEMGAGRVVRLEGRSLGRDRAGARHADRSA